MKPREKNMLSLKSLDDKPLATNHADVRRKLNFDGLVIKKPLEDEPDRFQNGGHSIARHRLFFGETEPLVLLSWCPGKWKCLISFRVHFTPSFRWQGTCAKAKESVPTFFPITRQPSPETTSFKTLKIHVQAHIFRQSKYNDTFGWIERGPNE